MSVTPHDMVFSYKAWVYPKLIAYRMPVMPEAPEVAPENGSRPKRRLPQVGETWLVRRLRTVRKFEKPWEKCKIIEGVNKLYYRVQTRDGAIKGRHLKHLKPCKQPSPADEAAFSAEGGV